MDHEKHKKYKGKSMRPGGGGRFKKAVDAMMGEHGMSEDRAKGIAAAQGRKKYGKAKFAAMGAAGRKRAAAKRRVRPDESVEAIERRMKDVQI